MNNNSGCLGIFFNLLKDFIDFVLGKPPTPSSYPYVKKKSLMTNAERSFYGVLKQVLGEHYEIFSMVRLADVIQVKKGTAQRQTHFNRICSKHLDFVCCDPATLEIVFAIELDDSSHNQKSRQKRDRFVDEACKASQIPLVRIPAKKGYVVSEVIEAIQAKLNQVEPIF